MLKQHCELSCQQCCLNMALINIFSDEELELTGLYYRHKPIIAPIKVNETRLYPPLIKM